MLSLIIDEVFKNNSALDLDLQDSELHTEDLTLNYKFPTLVDSFVVLKSKSTRLSNDEVQVRGLLQNAKGRTLVKATALLKIDEKKSENNVYHGLSDGSQREARRGWFWS